MSNPVMPFFDLGQEDLLLATSWSALVSGRCFHTHCREVGTRLLVPSSQHPLNRIPLKKESGL